MHKLKAELLKILIIQNFLMVKLVSEGQVLSNGKAHLVSKAERTRQYVSILNRIATQPPSIRWHFKTNF